MALQTSGQISLNDIHQEVGGTSASQVSINDADVRALIGKGSGASMSFIEWYGASSVSYWGSTFSRGTVAASTGTYVGAANNLVSNARYGACSIEYDATNNICLIAHREKDNTSDYRFNPIMIGLNLSDGTIFKVGGQLGGGASFSPSVNYLHGNNIAIIDGTNYMYVHDTYGGYQGNGPHSRVIISTTYQHGTGGNSNQFVIPTGGCRMEHYANNDGAIGVDMDFGGIAYLNSKVFLFGQHGSQVGFNQSNAPWIVVRDKDYNNQTSSTYTGTGGSSGRDVAIRNIIKNGTGYAYCGTNSLNAAGCIGYFTCSSYQPSSIVNYRNKVSGIATDYADIARDSSGNFYVCGMYNGHTAFLVKYTSNFAVSWARTIARTSGYYFKLGSVAVQSNGNVVVAGVETTYGNSNAGMWVGSFNSSGTIQFQKHVIYYDAGKSQPIGQWQAWSGNGQGTMYTRSCMTLGASDSILLTYRVSAASLHGDGSTANQTTGNWTIAGASRTISTVSSSAWDAAVQDTWTVSQSPPWEDRNSTGGFSRNGNTFRPSGGYDDAQTAIS